MWGNIANFAPEKFVNNYKSPKIMKKELSMLCLSLGAAALLSSCSEEGPFGPGMYGPEETEATGSVVLKLAADGSFSKEARAVNLDNYRNTSNYEVKVVNTSNDRVVLSCMGSEIEGNLPKTLPIGSYRATATYGKELAASRDQFLMTGETVFSLVGEERKEVEVTCTPTCGRVSVTFDPDMDIYYSDYSVTYGGTTALAGSTFQWKKGDSEPWFVAVSEDGETLTYTLRLTTKSDYVVLDGEQKSETGEVTGTFKLSRNKAHNLKVSPIYKPTTDGGVVLSIEIDETTNDQEVTWEVPVTWL